MNYQEFINHAYIYQAVKAGWLPEKKADNLISQLNRIYNQYLTRK